MYFNCLQLVQVFINNNQHDFLYLSTELNSINYPHFKPFILFIFLFYFYY